MRGLNTETPGARRPRPACGLAVVLLAAALVASACATRDRLAHPEIRAVAAGGANAGIDCRSQIRVMTLNLAHGRGEGLHQMLQSGVTAVRNLDRIRALLEREAPDLVAVQEADGPSFWSGGFDHVDYLAGSAALGQSVFAEHVSGPGLSYGTGLLARLPLSQPLAVTFDAVLAQPAKGFVIASFRWPDAEGRWVDIASVHLNPLSQKARQAQVQELVRLLRQRHRPLILMGDFNAEWQPPDSVLRRVGAELGLRAHRPEARDLISFPTLQRRLDWILISPELEFRGYRILSDAVSDHRPVVAELRLKPQDGAVGTDLAATEECNPLRLTGS